MVTSQDKEFRDRPDYSLDCIRDLARLGAVAYGGRRVEQDIENLGYSPDEVAKCLGCLDESNYHQSERSPPSQKWRDVYHMKWHSSLSYVDELYIKMSLNRDCTMIVLHSFHPHRWL